MIESFFISDHYDRLIFGSHPLLSKIGFTKSTDIMMESLNPVPNQIQAIKYPITHFESSKIARLKVNDVVLNVIYQDIDAFQAAKFLLDLRHAIEEKIIEIDKITIKRNYFKLLELLQTPEIPIKTRPFSFKEKVYIDLVQNIHCIMEGEHPIKNASYGEIFLNDDITGSLNIVLEKKVPLMVKSTQQIEEKQEMILIKSEDPEIRSILSFHQKDLGMAYFKLKRSENTIRIESDYKGLFKFIEISIPVGPHTYRVEATASGGTSEFKMKKGILFWRFTDVFFRKETIKFDIATLQEDKEVDPVTVNFRVESCDCSPLQLVSAENARFPTQQFWLRNTTQSGYYELN